MGPGGNAMTENMQPSQDASDAALENAAEAIREAITAEEVVAEIKRRLLDQKKVSDAAEKQIPALAKLADLEYRAYTAAEANALTAKNRLTEIVNAQLVVESASAARLSR